MIGRPFQRKYYGLPVAAAGLFALTLAVVLGWRAGQAQKVEPTVIGPAPWALPQARVSDPERDAAILRSRQPWGGTVAFRESEGQPPQLSPRAIAVPWHLAGIVARGDDRFALIEVERKPDGRLEYFAVGDSLPDGTVLVQIYSDSIVSQGREAAAAGPVVHRLFEKKP
jgi:hypothetical protein